MSIRKLIPIFDEENTRLNNAGVFPAPPYESISCAPSTYIGGPSSASINMTLSWAQTETQKSISNLQAVDLRPTEMQVTTEEIHNYSIGAVVRFKNTETSPDLDERCWRPYDVVLLIDDYNFIVDLGEPFGSYNSRVNDYVYALETRRWPQESVDSASLWYNGQTKGLNPTNYSNSTWSINWELSGGHSGFPLLRLYANNSQPTGSMEGSQQMYLYTRGNTTFNARKRVDYFTYPTYSITCKSPGSSNKTLSSFSNDGPDIQYAKIADNGATLGAHVGYSFNDAMNTVDVRYGGQFSSLTLGSIPYGQTGTYLLPYGDSGSVFENLTITTFNDPYPRLNTGAIGSSPRLNVMTTSNFVDTRFPDFKFTDSMLNNSFTDSTGTTFTWEQGTGWPE